PSAVRVAPRSGRSRPRSSSGSRVGARTTQRAGPAGARPSFVVMMKTLLLLVIPGCIATEAFGAAEVAVTSPDRKVRFMAFVRDGHLRYQATLNEQPLIEPSALGIAVDGVDLGQGAAIGAVDRYRLDESYPWPGVHARASH